MSGNNHCNGTGRRSSDGFRLIITTLLGLALGFFLGISIESLSISKHGLVSSLSPIVSMALIDSNQFFVNALSSKPRYGLNANRSGERHSLNDSLRIHVESNPLGPELLAPGIIISESDFFIFVGCGETLLRTSQHGQGTWQHLLLVLINQKNIDTAVKKFSKDFKIMLFHYDGRASGWEQFEWSQRAIHVSVTRQAKWWYAKHFLHPDVVVAYDYIIMWDKDLGLKKFDAKKYLHMVKKYWLGDITTSSGAK